MADALAGFEPVDSPPPSAAPTPDALAGFDEVTPPNAKYAKPGPYVTDLNPDEEARFQQWVKAKKVPFDPSPDSDYDMRGYWKDVVAKGRSETAVNQYDQQLHFPDTYKTPYHKSFSNESKYATDQAPHWVGNRYLIDPASGTPVYDDKNGPMGYANDEKGNPLPYADQAHQEFKGQNYVKNGWVGGRDIKPLGPDAGPQPPIPTAEQEALTRPLDKDILPAAGVAAGLATAGVLPTAIGTGIGLATEPAFRENIGKPVEKLTGSPIAGQIAETAAGLGLGAGMSEGTTSPGMVSEETPAAGLSPAERAGATDAEVVPNAQAAPSDASQKLLGGPASVPEPQPVEQPQAAPEQAALPPPERIESVPKSSIQGKAFHGVYDTENPTQTIEDIRQQGLRGGWFTRGDAEGLPPTALRAYLSDAWQNPTVIADEADVPAGFHNKDSDYLMPKWHPEQGIPEGGEKAFGNAPREGGYSIPPHKMHRLLGPDPTNPDNVLVQRLAPEPAQSGPRALPPPKENQIEPITLSENQEQQFVKGVLGRYPKGQPGLEVTSSDNPDSVFAHHVVYRGPDGTPVAAAQVYRERDGSGIGASGLATDKSRGLLSSRAAVEVAKELKTRGWDKPPADTQMTPDSINLMRRGADVPRETSPAPVEDKAPLIQEQQPKTDAEHEADAKAYNLAKNRRIQSIIKAPAIKMGDKVYAGETGDLHGEIYMRHPELVANLERKPITSGFMDHEGNFLTQREAADKADVGMVDALNLWPEETPQAGPQDAAKPIAAEEAPSSTMPQSIEGFEPTDVPAPEPQQDPFKRADVFEVPTKSAKLDPETFQYKVDVDAKTGVGKSLSGAAKYNPDFAGVEEMWYDDKTGQLYVSHGHHRHNLALQSDAPSVRAVILDSGNSLPGAIAHNVSKEEARTRGALINFSEGRGTVVDAANYLRNAPDMTPEKMKAMGLDLGEDKMSQALGVKNLTEPVWHQVSIGKLKPEVGAIIGKNLDLPRDQVNALKAWTQQEDRGKPFSVAKFDNLVKLIKNAQTHTEEQVDLFGAHQIARSTYEEQADILTYAQRELSMEKNVMGTAAKQKTRLEKGSNVINAETSQAMSKEAQDRLAVLQAYGDKPGTATNTVLKKFAAHLAEKPKQRAEILKEAHEALVKAIDQDNPGMTQPEEDTKTGSLF